MTIIWCGKEDCPYNIGNNDDGCGECYADEISIEECESYEERRDG